MGNFFSDPFGGSFAGRVYTKFVKSAAGDSSYSITQPKKNDSVWNSESTDDKFVDCDSRHQTLDEVDDDGFPINNDDSNNSQETQPSTWQKVKTAVSNWWNNNNNSSDADSPDSPNYVPVSSMGTAEEKEQQERAAQGLPPMGQ